MRVAATQRDSVVDRAFVAQAGIGMNNCAEDSVGEVHIPPYDNFRRKLDAVQGQGFSRRPPQAWDIPHSHDGIHERHLGILPRTSGS